MNNSFETKLLYLNGLLKDKFQEPMQKTLYVFRREPFEKATATFGPTFRDLLRRSQWLPEMTEPNAVGWFQSLGLAIEDLQTTEMTPPQKQRFAEFLCQEWMHSPKLAEGDPVRISTPLGSDRAWWLTFVVNEYDPCWLQPLLKLTETAETAKRGRPPTRQVVIAFVHGVDAARPLSSHKFIMDLIKAHFPDQEYEESTIVDFIKDARKLKKQLVG